MRCLAALLIAASAFGQGKQNVVQTGTLDAHGANWIPPTSTFASPPSSPAAGSVYVFTDASSIGACSGGGTSLATCRYSGSAWVATGSGKSAVQTSVSFSATPTFIVSASSIQTFTIALAGNVTSSTLTASSATAGQLIIFAVTQDSAARTFAWPSNVLNACAIGASPFTVTTVTTVWDGGNANAVGCVTTETPMVMTGPTRSAPGTPAAGTVVEWYDSTTNMPMAKDSSGNISSMVRVNPVVACIQATFSSPVAGDVIYAPPIPMASTVVGWAITAVGGSSPTATFDVWSIATGGTALPTVSNTITASAKPALATGNILKSSTIPGWIAALGQYASPAVRIDSLGGSPTKINLTVYCTR